MTSVSQPRTPEPALLAKPLTPAASRGPLTHSVGSGSGRERVLRVLYVGRLSLAASIFIAAIVVWRAADSTATLLATLAFVSALLFTAGSMWYSGKKIAPAGDRFFYVQVVFDLLLVTTIVHLTQAGTPSQLAPLYILVIAVSALVLPPTGVLLQACVAAGSKYR